MKRRNILLGSVALAAAPVICRFSAAAQGTADPSRLAEELTPFGAERAGNSTGTIPAWTGQDQPTRAALEAEAPLYTITAENMAQYAGLLADGQVQLLKRFPDYRINVYKTYRTACAPQYVYDNMAKNVSRAQPAPGGYVNGFTGTIGGAPFPIPSDDPLVAGPQIMWNHQARWQGEFYTSMPANFVVGNGTRTLTACYRYYDWNRYYDPNLTPETLYSASKFFNSNYLEYTAPPNLVGGTFNAMFSFTPAIYPATAYEYLVGEGRVREAPPAQYDVPSGQAGDAVNYDEANCFTGAMDRYIWKLVGKKEMIIPYNQSKFFYAQPEDVMGLQHINPDMQRWEIHRCWVIEARLAPGKRMTEPFRRFYVDEDTWTACLSDAYDDQQNYWKHDEIVMEFHPDLPGFTVTGALVYNLQEGVYTWSQVYYNAPPPLGGFPTSFGPVPVSKFDVQSMANNGGL